MTSIRRLAADDFEIWEPFWQGYLEFYKASVPPETTRLTFARLTGGGEPMGGFIAHDDASNPIGIVHWITHRSTWTEGPYCYLQDLFVASEKRGAGVGRALIDAVYSEGRARGCSRVYWLTHETNVLAMKLYDAVADRTGFTQYRKLLC